MPDREQTMHESVLAPSSSAGDEATTLLSTSAETDWVDNADTPASNRRGSQGEPPFQLLSDDPAELETTTSSFEAEPAINASPTPHELNRSLARLEQSSLEVKHYLDAIEEKISRMEPRLEQLSDTQLPTVTPEQAAAEFIAIDFPSSITLPTESTTERRRRRFDIPSPESFNDRLGAPLLNAGQPLEEEPWALKPWLFARRRQLAVAGIVFFTFITVLTFSTGNRNRPTGNPSVLAPNSSSPASGNVISKSAAGTSVVRPPSGLNPGLTPSASGSDSSLSGSVTPPSDAIAGSSTSNADPQISAGNSSSPATVAGKTSQLTEPGPRPTPAANLAPAGRIRVSSGVMAGNLLYSPTPKYPGGLARLFHTEGKVTLQAIIARNGRVEDLRVLSGHHLLRGAAQDAVRTWRYRPYSVAGVPVEVATIITVEFHR